jgi:hypothetical protein
MTWEARLLGLFDDLEQQAEGLHLAERDALVGEQRRAEYAEVDLAARLHGSVGVALRADVVGVGVLAATLLRVGAGWCLLEVEGREWIVVLGAVRSWRGLAERAVDPAARPATARLGLGSALRRVAEARAAVLVHRADGSVLRGALGRVGADFVEVRAADETGPGYPDVVPFGVLTALRPA